MEEHRAVRRGQLYLLYTTLSPSTPPQTTRVVFGRASFTSASSTIFSAPDPQDLRYIVTGARTHSLLCLGWVARLSPSAGETPERRSPQNFVWGCDLGRAHTTPSLSPDLIFMLIMGRSHCLPPEPLCRGEGKDIASSAYKTTSRCGTGIRYRTSSTESGITLAFTPQWLSGYTGLRGMKHIFIAS